MSDDTRDRVPDEPWEMPPASSGADYLLELLFGKDFRLAREARSIADWVRANREQLESAVDDLLGLYETPSAEAEPQEGRIALSVIAFRESVREDPDSLESILITMELAIERLATLSAAARADARTASLAQATPAGTHTLRDGEPVRFADAEASGE